MEEMQKKVSNVMKTGEVTPLRTHMLPVLLTLSVFFFFFFFSPGSFCPRDVWLFPTVALSKCSS